LLGEEVRRNASPVARDVDELVQRATPRRVDERSML
jgi:hypothetical protein